MLISCQLCAVKGGDLHEALDLDGTAAAEGLMTWYHQGANIALDIARALAFLHSRKVSLFHPTSC